VNSIQFKNRLSEFHIFSTQDIFKAVPNFSYRQLDRWVKKDYIIKIKKGFYIFADKIIHYLFLYQIANIIYSPSYISLEKALKIYGFIPEEVFQITSVTTKKANNFETALGNFKYQHIKPGLYWGYKLMKKDGFKILIAEPEKAILDYLYLHPEFNTQNYFIELRINIDVFYEQINFEKLQKYLKAFNNKALTKRTQMFLEFLKTLKND